MSKKPNIGITMGDPNGISPEIVVKAINSTDVQNVCTPVIFGSGEILESAANLTGLKINCDIYDPANFEKADLRPCRVDKKAGEASLSYIRQAVKAAKSGKIDAIVTAPISKQSTHLAGSKFPGHTEMLKELTGAKEAVMMFEGGKFRVVLVTIHTALRDVPKLITKDRVLSVITITHRSLVRQFKIPEPKIVVCGLNPHAGESGAFGDEEILHISPAIAEARKMGISIIGPLPADTLFYYANTGKWDAVVAMYHDQGLIPFKMLSFNLGVNLTLGLPIIRTSPDHGTAFNIAWKGVADPSSMIAAVNIASRLATDPVVAARRTPS
jgi:4-hydroxythreonine-4-phosphate dehydrogenase